MIPDANIGLTHRYLLVIATGDGIEVEFNFLSVSLTITNLQVAGAGPAYLFGTLDLFQECA